MNINEIAKRASVSTATVSRTINGSDKVFSKTADRVWRVVRSMGYHPSSYARALASGRSHLLGLIISDIVNPFFAELVKSFEEFAIQNGKEVIVVNTSYDSERMSLGIRRMIERKAEGVAVMTTEMDENFIAQLQARHIPLVFLDIGRTEARTSNIQVNYGMGIGEAMEHLARLGHRRMGLITGPIEHASAQARRAAFLASLRSLRLPNNRKMIQRGNFQTDGGEAAMQRFLAMNDRPTAVVCSNDMTAIGAMRAIHHAGLRIPEDISIVGFDDIAFGNFTHPPLTTIRLSRTDLAENAYDALAKMIDEKPQKGCVYKVETHLVVRESTAAAPAK